MIKHKNAQTEKNSSIVKYKIIKITLFWFLVLAVLYVLMFNI